MTRCFVAVDIEPHIQALIAELQRELPPGLRLVEPHQVHLTLKFLGEVPRERVPALIERLKEVEPRLLKLETTRLGTFSHVLWLGVRLTKGLAQLQQEVARASRPFALHDPRPYKPHLTIARFGTKPESLDERRVAARWRAEGFTLYESTMGPQGVVYEALAHFRRRDFAGTTSNAI